MRIDPFQCSLLWMLCCGPVLGDAVDSNCDMQPMLLGDVVDSNRDVQPTPSEAAVDTNCDMQPMPLGDVVDSNRDMQPTLSEAAVDTNCDMQPMLLGDVVDSNRDVQPTLSEAAVDTNCGVQPMRASIRYSTPKGIGYKTGYTTLEAFLAPNILKGGWLPFLDLRGHVFDNGKLAANAGIGLRRLGSSRVWGVNGYYDYRNTSHQHYNQVSAGLESLGRVWDFRINGYFPIGRKQSPYFHRSTFYAFQGNSMLIKNKRDFAMKGANAEVGLHVDFKKDKTPLYFAGGPYYLTGVGKTTWGGKLRANIELFNRYLRIEGITAYDHFFKWTGQAQISLNISFGGKNQVGKSCPYAMTLQRRAVQRVDRNEIIPVGRQSTTSPAINPETGKPWIFWFVDNTSHSAGTYENPFSTLLDAQNASSANQGIYVYPGDGTTNGMSSGILLQDGQLFLGASIAHSIPTTRGTIIIPPMASSLPNIANTTGAGNIVTLGNNNTVSGFSMMPTVDTTANGIYGNGISNLTADHNLFVSSTTITTNGISLINPSGRVLIDSSTFNGFTCNNASRNGNGIYIKLDSGYSLDVLNITGSSFSNLSQPGGGGGGNGINIFSGTIGTFSSSGNTFSNISHGGTGITNFGTISFFNSSGNTFSNINHANGIINNATISSFNSSGDTFSNISHASNGIVNHSMINTFSSSGNTFSDISDVSVGIFISSGMISTFSSSGNAFSDISGSSIGIINSGTIDTFNSSGNAFSDISDVSIGIINSGTIDTFNSSGNAFSDISDVSIGIFNANIINTFSSSGDIFSNISNNSNGIYNRNIITVFNSSGNSFSNISNGSVGINNGGTINTFSSTEDTFSGLNSSYGISYTLNNNAANVSVNIVGNTFSGTTGLANGFASSITATSGTLCLNFTDNIATPTSSPSPYLFEQTNGGTFNRTAGSDDTTNTGEIEFIGTVNPTGSCSQLLEQKK